MSVVTLRIEEQLEIELHTLLGSLRSWSEDMVRQPQRLAFKLHGLRFYQLSATLLCPYDPLRKPLGRILNNRIRRRREWRKTESRVLNNAHGRPTILCNGHDRWEDRTVVAAWLAGPRGAWPNLRPAWHSSIRV